MVSRGAALFMEMGTGKTKAMIDVTGVLHANGIISRALVVAPLPIVDAWGNEEFGELTKHAGNDRNIWFPILGKSKKQREDALKAMLQYKGPKMVWGLINIEGLVVVKDALKSLKPDLMLLDESTIIKNRTAQRTKLAIELFEATPFKVISSGNPIPKSPDEIFAQYKLIEPGAYGSSFMSFREKFFEVDYFNKIKGFKPGRVLISSSCGSPSASRRMSTRETSQASIASAALRARSTRRSRRASGMRAGQT